MDERGLVMFRKVTIALLATAALEMLAPDVVSARGGGGQAASAVSMAASTAVVSTVAALAEAVFTARRSAGADSGPAQSPELAAWRSA